MDQLIEILREGLMVIIDRNKVSAELMKMDVGEEMPGEHGLYSEEEMRAVQGGDSDVEMPAVQGGDSEEMPSNLRSDERLQFRREEMDQLIEIFREGLMVIIDRTKVSAELMMMEVGEGMPGEYGLYSEEEMRPVQGEDSEVEMSAVQGGDSEEMPSNRVSEGLQLHTAGQRPKNAVIRSELLQILTRLKDQDSLFKLLQYVKENQLQNQENQPNIWKALLILLQSIQPSTVKELLAKMLKYGEENQSQKQDNQPQKQENQPQKQENQRQKQNKKHHRKSRMPLRKIAMEKVKKSNLEKPRLADKEAAFLAAAREEERELEDELEARKDWHAYEARLCRDRWNESSAARGKNTYETITSIPPMRFTDRVNRSACPCETLQIFSVKVAEIKEGAHWPLYVYGTLAVRDTVDRKRNIIFDRKRDNFQTVNMQDPYLTLTGPSRAAVLSVHHSYIEAELKIKGSSSDDSDDKDFSYLATGYIQTAPCESFISKRVLSSRLSTLELTVGHIVNSVEATVSVEVSGGKWPSGYGGVCMVSTASMNTMEIVLLSFGDHGLPLENDGKKVRLSRSVVGVEVDGSLTVAVKALLPGGSSDSEDELSDKKFFTPKESGRSNQDLKVGSCDMKVSVAWSLLLTYDY